MRGIAAATALVGGLGLAGGLGGCLKRVDVIECPGTHALCPLSQPVCLPEPYYCGDADMQQALSVCSGQPQLTLCSTDAIPSGVCYPDQCITCTADYGTCPVSGWQQMTQSVGKDPQAVWITSATDAFVAEGKATIAHYDGLSWTDTTFPGSTPTKLWRSPNGTLFVLDNDGSDNVEVYSGGSWRQPIMTKLSFVSGLWGTSSNEILVGGTGYVLSFDLSGNSTDMHAPDMGAEYSVVWASDDVIIAAGVALLWQSVSGVWSDVGSSLKLSLGSLYGLAGWIAVGGSSSNDIFAVATASNGNTIAVHYDGSSWTALTVPSDATMGAVNLLGVTSVGPANAIVVGNLAANSSAGVILQCNAQTCNPVYQPSVALSAVSAVASPIDVMALGKAVDGTTLVFRTTSM
ncbi:MAG TPA: hypothetical protein VMJ10_07670 [Kofleriaceae bacterium]|nr:hypothetical protein [Kofleriaceae bacterium]